MSKPHFLFEAHEDLGYRSLFDRQTGITHRIYLSRIWLRHEQTRFVFEIGTPTIVMEKPFTPDKAREIRSRIEKVATQAFLEALNE